MAADLGTDPDRAPVRCHGKIKDRFRWATALWRSFPNDRNRRYLAVRPRLGERPLTTLSSRSCRRTATVRNASEVGSGIGSTGWR
jgi:hypothetical protein